MSVWDKNYQRTNEANDLDCEVISKLYPILDEALKTDLTPEDIFCIVAQATYDWVLTTILSRRR